MENLEYPVVFLWKTLNYFKVGHFLIIGYTA